MYNHILYLVYWLINSAVLYLAAILVPQVIVLGNWRFSSLEAAIYAGFWLTVLIWLWWDFAIAKKFRLDKKTITFAFFLFVNSSSLLIISRFNYLTGFILVNYFWVLAIGLVVTILQRAVWRLIVNKGSFF